MQLSHGLALVSSAAELMGKKAHHVSRPEGDQAWRSVAFVGTINISASFTNLIGFA